MIKAFLICISLNVLVSASTPARCGPLFGNRKCPCVGSGKPWDMNQYCDEVKGECGPYRSSYDASSGFYDCETNVVETLPTGCLKIENGNFAGIYKVSGLHAGKNRYVHTTDPSKVISWVHIGRYAWHITQNGQGIMHWYHDRDAYGINIGNDGNPAAGVIPGIPDLSAFPEIVSDYESQAEGCMPAVTRPTKPTYEVDYGNGVGWVSANTVLTNKLNYASNDGNYKWREVSAKLNNKAKIAFLPYDKLRSNVGQTLKIRCRNKCEVFYIWMDKIVLCTRHESPFCSWKFSSAPKRPSSFATLMDDWKDEGVNQVAQQYTPYFNNYHDLTRTPTGHAHGSYLVNMAAKSKVLNWEQITVGPANAVGNFWIAFIEASSSQAPSLTPTKSPTSAPSLTPTKTPTSAPSLTPTKTPTSAPSLTPTKTPTSAPSLTPTKTPSPAPSAQEFMMKIKGFHGNPVSSLARIVFSQERTEVEKIVTDAKTIKAAKDTTRKN